MYALKRIVAYGIDYGLLLFVTMVCMQSAESAIQAKLAQFVPVNFILAYASMAITYGIPVLVLGSLIGLVGWTPG